MSSGSTELAVAQDLSTTSYSERLRQFEALAALELNHGQALWVLSELGFDVGAKKSTFNYYIKSLRKLGVPFRRGEIGLQAERSAKYSFNHLTELSVALSLRTYGILPDVVVRGLIDARRVLYSLYRESYLESDHGKGAPIELTAAGPDTTSRFSMSGVYLDLRLVYVAGQLISIGPPRTLSPAEAMVRFATAEPPVRAGPPINLSKTTLKIAELMERAPQLRRGPKPVRRASARQETAA
ncbi:MAG TPA: hypothetical protein VMF32_03030 [Xanthobacteraceae bacterium]|nr:hypothetical protein [Xanthobacteraceae bacterium]